MLSEKLKGSHVLIVTHVYGTGPPQDLEEYLKDRVGSLVFIGHPFPYATDRRSFWRRWENGKEIAAGQAVNWRGPEIIFYLKDALLTLWWSWRHGGPYDLVVGAGGFNAVLGLLLRGVMRTKKVVFYCIDWVPQRFSNPLLNWVYRWLDRVAVSRADRTWNLSTRMAEVREQRGLDVKAKQLTIPVGIWLQRFPRRDKQSLSEISVMYMGHVREGQGLSLLVETWPMIIKRYPVAKLHMIGDGPLRSQLQASIEDSGVGGSVIWHGFVSDHRQVEKMLVQGDLAMALYEPGTFTQYTDPGKLKVYLAAGLPIVMSKIGQMADLIEQHRAGIVIPYERAALVEAVNALLTDEKLREEAGQAAFNLAAQYDWETIFAKALKQTL